MIFKFALVLLLLSFPCFAMAHGGGEVGERSSKGVIEISHDLGFKLSEAAFTRLKIKTQSVTLTKSTTHQNLKTKTFQVPHSALVYALNEVILYVYQNGFFKHLEVINTSQPKSKSSPSSLVQVEVKDFNESSQQVVIQGADFLRVVEMDLNAEGEDEHHGE